jgi:hypothetical protein
MDADKELSVLGGLCASPGTISPELEYRNLEEISMTKIRRLQRNKPSPHGAGSPCLSRGTHQGVTYRKIPLPFIPSHQGRGRFSCEIYQGINDRKLFPKKKLSDSLVGRI